MAPTAALVALALALALALAGVQAYDECYQVNGNFDVCELHDICERCLLESSSCVYDRASRSCQLMDAAANSTLCTADDAQCADCGVRSPTCVGADGCTCRSVCSAVRNITGPGCAVSAKLMLYLGCALASLTVLAVFVIQRKCSEHSQRRTMLLEVSRERPGPPVRVRNPRNARMAVSLESWREHVENHKPEPGGVELAPCGYVRMAEDDVDGGGSVSSQTRRDAAVIPVVDDCDSEQRR